MYGAGQLRTSAVRRIIYRVVAKRNVSDSRVKEVFGKRRVLEGLRVDGRIRVEFGSDARGDGIKFNARAPGTRMQTLRHQTKEVTDAHRWFENLRAWLESESLHRIPNRLNY